MWTWVPRLPSQKTRNMISITRIYFLFSGGFVFVVLWDLRRLDKFT